MRKWLILFVTVTGCASQARLPASYFGEDARTLDRGHVSVTAAGGGGIGVDGDAGGFGGRVRVGIGGHQEVGVEASQIEINSTYDTCLGDSCLSGPSPTASYEVRSRSALATWKLSYRDHYAVIAGLGGSEHATLSGMPASGADTYGHSLDAALAFIASGHVNETSTVYSGVRAMLAVPIGANNSPDASRVLGFTGAWRRDRSGRARAGVHRE